MSALTNEGAGQSGENPIKSLLGVRASRRLRLLEGFQFHACIKCSHRERQTIKADSKPFAIEDLRNQAAIGQRWGMTKTIS
jgi:hypothetical protein